LEHTYHTEYRSEPSGVAGQSAWPMPWARLQCEKCYIGVVTRILFVSAGGSEFLWIWTEGILRSPMIINSWDTRRLAVMNTSRKRAWKDSLLKKTRWRWKALRAMKVNCLQSSEFWKLGSGNQHHTWKGRVSPLNGKQWLVVKKSTNSCCVWSEDKRTMLTYSPKSLGKGRWYELANIQTSLCAEFALLYEGTMLEDPDVTPRNGWRLKGPKFRCYKL